MKKRSRNAGSTSLADVLILDLEAKRARTVTTTLNVESFSSFGIRKLLEECGWCRKWISPTTDVYMYAGFAYCTEKCREWQYDKDANAGRISPVRNAEVLNKSLVCSLYVSLVPRMQFLSSNSNTELIILRDRLYNMGLVQISNALNKQAENMPFMQLSQLKTIPENLSNLHYEKERKPQLEPKV